MKIIYLTLFVYFSLPLWASDAGLILQNKLNHIRTLQAQFSQKVEAHHRVLSKSTGSMALIRPGKFRWQSDSPIAQLIVADGKKLWIYDIDLEQVTVKKQDEGMGDAAALFLSGANETLTKDFKIELTKSLSDFNFKLTPISKDSTYAQVELKFKSETLTRLVFLDQLGQTTSVSLSSIKQNIKLNPELFRFSPPKGVDVVLQ